MKIDNGNKFYYCRHLKEKNVGKRVYNDWNTSVFALCIGFVISIISGVLIFLVLINAANTSSKILWSLILGLLFMGGIYCIILSLKKGFDYWYITEDSIYYKKPFRRKVVIKLDNIESVERTTIESLGSSKYSPEEVYIVHSQNKVIVIYAEEDRKESCKHILKETKEMLSKYLT